MDHSLTHAACVGKRWWPWRGTPTDQAHLWDAAVHVCASCPCRQPCAVFALDAGETNGTVWAGVRLTGGRGRTGCREQLRAVAGTIGA